MTLATARSLVMAAPPELREAILGDLEEEYRAIAERRGDAAAARWLRRQVMRSLPHLAWLSTASASDGAWFRAAGVVGTLLGILATATRRSRRPPGPPSPPMSGEDAA